MNKNSYLFREVTVAPAASTEWQVLLDGKPAKTPAGHLLTLPAKDLAERIADEWRGGGNETRPGTMQFTRLANTAIDRVAPNRRGAIDELLKCAGADLLCFRASAPNVLVERQSAFWDPLLEWALGRYGIELKVTCGITPMRQPPDELQTLESFITQLDDFVLTGLVAAASSLGSAILALALYEERIDAEAAFAAAELDTTYQAEIWGKDPLMAVRDTKKGQEVSEIAQFFELSGTF